MKIEEVKKLPPIDRFCYWIRERHQIHLKRKAGKPKPWTDDEVLQSVFFTNPYRENDKVTVWFRENIREPLRDQPEVIFATVAFRWFNYPETAKKLIGYRWKSKPLGLFQDWDAQAVLNLLGPYRDEGGKIFTGAYMVNSPAGKPKLEAIVERIDEVWKKRDDLVEELLDVRNYEVRNDPDYTHTSLQEAHKLLMQFPGMGGFMAYEVVCDLRYTYVLENAPDIMTWANPGPGAIRGMCRLLGIDFPKGRNSHGFTPAVKFDFQEECRKLLTVVQKRLPKMPKFEMREIEHSLCESDKYERVLWNDGRAKRMFNGKT